MNRYCPLILAGVIVSLVSASALAQIDRVRVLNKSDKTIYIHKGGFAPSVRIAPGRWHIFHYPFKVIPPGHSKKISTSLLVATAGGRWMTRPNGYTYLAKPTLLLCLNYAKAEHAHKTGNRLWTINKSTGFSKDCRVQGYKQPWYQPQKSH